MKLECKSFAIGALAVAVSSLLVISCTDAEWERQTAVGNEYKVIMYSGGQKVAEWTSTGRVESLAAEDGWQFVDKESKHLIIVTGDIVIEKLP